MTRTDPGAKAILAITCAMTVLALVTAVAGCSGSQDQSRQAALAAQQAQVKAEQAQQAADRARVAAQQAQIAAARAQKAVDYATREINRVADRLERNNRENGD